MDVSDIRATHERLEATKATHSAKIVNELKSDAHKHRGILLERISELELALSKSEQENAGLRAEIAEIWETGDVPRTVDELVARIEDEVSCIDGPPQHYLAPGLPYTAYSIIGVKEEGDGMPWAASEEDAVRGLWRVFQEQSEGKRFLYWRIRPEVKNDNGRVFGYMRFALTEEYVEPQDFVNGTDSASQS